MFSLICAWINGWVNNREAGDLRRHGAHYGIIVMGMDFNNLLLFSGGEHMYLWHIWEICGWHLFVLNKCVGRYIVHVCNRFDLLRWVHAIISFLAKGETRLCWYWLKVLQQIHITLASRAQFQNLKRRFIVRYLLSLECARLVPTCSCHLTIW